MNGQNIYKSDNSLAMGNKKVSFTAGDGKPIHKKGTMDGIKSQHKASVTRAKKRKLRKKKSR